MVRVAFVAYCAIALVVLGVQLPIRLAACATVEACTVSLLKAPVWSLIWPVYLPLAFLPRQLVQATAFMAVALGLALALVWLCERYLPLLADDRRRDPLPSEPQA
jgi:hypothetical protein